MLKVFVYGTLKPGYANYQTYCGDRTGTQQPAMVRGKLFDLPVGYPGMTYGEDWVKGYLLSFAEDKIAEDEILASLDELEGYECDQPANQNLYQRCWIEVFDVEGQFLTDAWAYFMSFEQVKHLGGIWVQNGQWK